MHAYLLKKDGEYEVAVLPDGRVRFKTRLASALGPGLQLGEWSHVGVVSAGDLGFLYVNGDLIVSEVGGGKASMTVDNMILGNDQTFARPLTGAIDNVRVWEAALDATDMCLAAGRGDC